jgi:hypothetical protein
MTSPSFGQDDDWIVSVRIEADLHWRTPAENTDEQILREYAEHVIKRKAHEFESELRAILTSDIKTLDYKV